MKLFGSTACVSRGRICIVGWLLAFPSEKQVLHCSQAKRDTRVSILGLNKTCFNVPQRGLMHSVWLRYNSHHYYLLMWWLNYRGRFGDIRQLTGQSESWLLFFWYAGISGCLFFFTFLALAEKVPQSLTHKWWVISFFWFIFTCGVLSLLSPVHLLWSLPCKWNRETAGKRPSTDANTSKDSIQIQEPHWCWIKRARARPGWLDRSVQMSSSPLSSFAVTLSHVFNQCHISLPPYRLCYSMVNLLNWSLTAVCIVLNHILLEDRNNWVLKGIMSVPATL